MPKHSILGFKNAYAAFWRRTAILWVFFLAGWEYHLNKMGNLNSGQAHGNRKLCLKASKERAERACSAAFMFSAKTVRLFYRFYFQNTAMYFVTANYRSEVTSQKKQDQLKVRIGQHHSSVQTQTRTRKNFSRIFRIYWRPQNIYAFQCLWKRKVVGLYSQQLKKFPKAPRKIPTAV